MTNQESNSANYPEVPKNPENEKEARELLLNLEEGARLELKDPSLDNKEARVGKIEKVRESDGRVWRKIDGKTYTHNDGGVTKPSMGINHEYASVEVIKRSEFGAERLQEKKEDILEKLYESEEVASYTHTEDLLIVAVDGEDAEKPEIAEEAPSALGLTLQKEEFNERKHQTLFHFKRGVSQ